MCKGHGNWATEKIVFPLKTEREIFSYWVASTISDESVYLGI